MVITNLQQLFIQLSGGVDNYPSSLSVGMDEKTSQAEWRQLNDRRYLTQGMWTGCQMACKPGSVSHLRDAGGDDHSSSAGCCQPPQATYPDIGAGSHQPQAACVPTWSCSGWGLPCPACYQSGGALLPHLFTLTYMRPVGCAGGLFSAALSLGSPPPGVTRHPDPVEPGLSSPTRFLLWWQRSSSHLTAPVV